MTMPERKALITTMRAVDQVACEFESEQRAQFIAQAVREDYPRFAEQAETIAWVFITLDEMGREA